MLASRGSAFDDAVARQFGELRSSRIRRMTGTEGWFAGELAADRAKLTQGDLDVVT